MFMHASEDKRRKPAKRLLEQIAEKDWFQSLRAKIKELEHLQNAFDKATHFRYMPHCRILEINQNCLLIGVENGSWATQLKYNTPTLLEKLHLYPEFQMIKTIRSHIFTAHSSKKLSAPPKSICPESASMIVTIAQGITEPALKQALLRLARAL